MTRASRDPARIAAFIVGGLIVLRLIAATITPLTFDEAYYWTWSRHLAGGYYDHPPMVAVVIWLGTLIGGDTAFGVRVVSVLLAIPMSWATYRAAMTLFADPRLAATATVLLNATLLASVGTTIVTPDAPLLIASPFVLWSLAEVWRTGDGRWWLAAGAAVGVSLLSKYTAFFFGAEILLWLLLIKDQRRWLGTPWPYLGGVVAFAIFSPTIWWNAQHGWVSFIKQLGRARVDTLTLKYFSELVPSQLIFVTPSIFFLGALGLYALARERDLNGAVRTLLNVSVWVITGYFLWHSLHQRVEGNWLAPVYPAFAIAAAYAAHGVAWPSSWEIHVDRSRRWALPIGVLLFVVLIVQVNTGVFTGFRRDPSMRSIGVGWTEMANDLAATRDHVGASCILGGDYGITAQLIFYLPKDACVAERVERIRWFGLPEPDAALLRGKVLLVGVDNGADLLRDAYARTERLPDAVRYRSGVAVQRFEVDVLDGPKGDPLDRSPPRELTR